MKRLATLGGVVMFLAQPANAGVVDPGLARAVAGYVARERRAVTHEAALLSKESPYRRAKT